MVGKRVSRPVWGQQPGLEQGSVSGGRSQGWTLQQFPAQCSQAKEVGVTRCPEIWGEGTPGGREARQGRVPVKLGRSCANC